MSGATPSLTGHSTHPRPSQAPRSRRGQIGRVVWHTLVVLLAAGVVIAAAESVAHTSAAASIPMTFLPGAAAREGGPPAGAPQPGATDAGSGQPVRGRPQAAGQPAGQSGAGSQGQGLFSGRNAPSLQRGLPDLARYAGIFAVLVAGVALVLRVIRPRRRRHARPTRGVQLARLGTTDRDRAA
jgi:hypothetical protein